MFGLIAALSGVSGAQSSSLYLRENVTPTVPNRVDVSKTANGQPNLLSPAIAKVSFAAVSLPKPRTFAKHDLITIIVRESTENNSKSTLDTEKETKVAGELSDFPNISVKDLLNFQLGASDFSRGKPKIGLDLSTEFEGEGNFKRKDTFVTRITAEIITRDVAEQFATLASALRDRGHDPLDAVGGREVRLQQGETSNIEQLVNGVSKELRPVLLRELIEVELEVRAERGESLATAE